jgi:putative heme iron utilization protein
LVGAEELIAAEPDILGHMNADHADTMNLYATKLLGAQPGEWRAISCDPAGLDLQRLDMQEGHLTLRLDFPRRIVTPAALRQVLKELADQARKKAK